MAIKHIKTPGAGDANDYVLVEHFATGGSTYISAKVSEEQSVRVSNEAAHALANWILENVPKPDPLPKESGVYAPKTAGLHDGPVVFVNYKGTWRSTPSVSDAENSARIWAESTGLVRLSKIEEN